ncbi:MAG: type II CAAX endopeptidase family protein [bacterium]
MHRSVSHAIRRIETSRIEIFIQIVLVFIIPVALIYAKIIPITDRVFVLVGMVTLFTGILVYEKWTPSMFFLERSTLKKYFLPYLAFTIIMMLLLIGFGEYIIKNEEIKRWWTHSHFLYLFFVVSFFQEVAYRGYLIPALGKLSRNVPMIVITNTLIFVFLHTIFPNPMVGLPVAFVGGIGFAVMYLRYPSLPLIILSHAALNFCAVLYGFFIIPGITH